MRRSRRKKVCYSFLLDDLHDVPRAQGRGDGKLGSVVHTVGVWLSSRHFGLAGVTSWA